MFPVGVSVACSTRVSNLLGNRDATGANLAAKVSVFYAGLVGIVMASVLYLPPHTYFPSLFTPDNDIIQEAAKTIPYIALYVFADGIQYTISGIVKGCGKQCIVMPVVVVAYWIVGLPLAYFLAFRWRKSREYEIIDNPHSFEGIIGLVCGMTVGTWTHFLLLAVVVGFGTNWDTEVLKAQERITIEDKNNHASRTYAYKKITSGDDDLPLAHETIPLKQTSK